MVFNDWLITFIRYVRRIKINSTFSKFDNIISDEEIQKYSKKIWKDAHEVHL